MNNSQSLMFSIFAVGIGVWRIWRLREINTEPLIEGQRRVLKGEGQFPFVVSLVIWIVVVLSGLWHAGVILSKYLAA